MEIHKDNQKDNGVSSLQYDAGLFHEDRDFYVAYKKIERIVSALFLVTGLIEKNDVLKRTIQEHGLSCLKSFTDLIGKTVGVSDIQLVSARVLHINSLINIAFWSGEVSQMNSSILEKEVASAYKMLNDLSLKYKSTYFIGASFFDQQSESVTRQEHIDKGPRLNKRQEVLGGNSESKSTHKGHEVKDNTIGHSKTVTTDAGKGQRREAILNLLRSRPNLTIKDFTSVVPEYSEKTIQRELLALVEEGIVRKEGERRWSTYSLAV